MFFIWIMVGDENFLLIFNLNVGGYVYIMIMDILMCDLNLMLGVMFSG